MNDSQIDSLGTDSATLPLDEVSALEFARWQTGGVAGDLVPGAVEAWAAAIEKRDKAHSGHDGFRETLEAIMSECDRWLHADAGTASPLTITRIAILAERALPPEV